MKIAKEFIEKTKYQHMKVESAQEKGEKQPELQKAYDDGLELLNLPDPDGLEFEPINLKEIVEQRKSLRSYSQDKLTLDELSYLLWMTQGVKKNVKGKATFRTVPSAGARHAFETYILINRVEGLKPGIYRYLALEHKLLPYNMEDDIADQVVVGSLNQKFVKESAVTFMWTAVTQRMTWRYKERGYRFLFLDAGHVCQNLYLASESINAGTCAIAAYSDDDMNEILDVDGEGEFVIYMAAVGKK